MLVGCGFLNNFALFEAHRLQLHFAKICFSHCFFTIFEPPGPLFEASVSKPFRKSYAFDMRKMYKNGISRLFLMLFFNPLKCNILLLALVVSLFLDRRESTFFIIVGPNIVSCPSVAVGHPRQMLCFLHSGDPFPPRGICCHFYTFFNFFQVFA